MIFIVDKQGTKAANIEVELCKVLIRACLFWGLLIIISSLLGEETAGATAIWHLMYWTKTNMNLCVEGRCGREIEIKSFRKNIINTVHDLGTCLF